jgi:hypothetical protein
MELSVELFEGVLEWLHKNYHTFTFYTARDIVWIMQTSMTKIIKKKNLPFRVFHDYGPLQTNRRKNYIDLVVLDTNDTVLIAAEFRFEPSHKRTDIASEKFPVISWDKRGIRADADYVKEYVAKDVAKIAYLVLIDEGGHFRKRNPLPDTEWIDWEPVAPDSKPVSLLWLKVERAAPEMKKAERQKKEP